MLRCLRIAVTSTLTGLLLFGWFTRDRWQATRQPPPAPTAAVVVEHELVHIEHPTADVSAPAATSPVAARPVAAPARKFVPSRIIAKQHSPARVVPAARNRSIAARAKRIVFGDGRYRPQPFPGSGGR